MKQFLSIILLLLAGFFVRAQYNNEWIDYNKTYYKFPVGKDGVCRINFTTLQSLGLANTPAEQFQLWRNGVQVPIYTTSTTGVLSAGGYIEFWGQMNDGVPDRKLYRDINHQLSDKWSLETDTASYFLTVNQGGGNIRLAPTVNDVAGSGLTPDAFFMYTFNRSFRNKINPGYAGIVGEYIYSSVYDKGEGYTSDDIYPGGGFSETLSDLFPYVGGFDGTFFITGFGNANNNRTLRVKVNNVQLVDGPMDSFNDLKQQVSMTAGLLASGSATVVIQNTASNPYDRMVIGKYELTYARQFNFGGASNFVFELAANPNGNLLRISNFSSGASVPVLYDLTNFRRYDANTSESGYLKFALLGSNQRRKLVLVSEETSNITNINNNQFTTRNFVDYSQANNQGDYLIISNPLLYNGVNGNPVEAYRQYRSSAAGGGYNVTVCDIDQLTDQFALGIKRHPFAIKNFLKYSRNTFALSPRAVFLIGKGVSYPQAKGNESNPLLDRMNLIPPFGYPASDNLLASIDNETISAIPIGRLSAVTPQEVTNYLEKVKEYETIGQNAPQTIAGRGWMKNIVHAIGGGDPELSAQIGGYMNQMKQTIEGPFYGGNVESFSKSPAVASQLTGDGLKSLFSEGIGILDYFGHSSASTIEFNIEDPSVYQNQGKYPVFLVNGCLAGDIFDFHADRGTTVNTLSEKYVLADRRGGIAFVASSHFGVVTYLNTYLQGLYKDIANSSDRNIGRNLEESFKFLLSKWPGDYFARLHAEEVTLHGDPAIKLYASTKPDYVVESQYVYLPDIISVVDKNFKLKVNMFNIGQAISDSVMVNITRTLPGGATVSLFNNKIAGIRNRDSLMLTIAINPALEKGENKITVTIDPDNQIDEVSKFNNSVTKTFYIIEDVATPIYPYDFAIIKESSQKLYASSANPLKELSNYRMEIDTTALFNSPFKTTKTLSSPGGLLEFDPQFSYKDSTVYYWRVSLTPNATDETPVWSTRSFMYKLNTEGYNQSHYFQQEQSEMSGLSFDSTSRTLKYGNRTQSLFVRNCIYQPGCGNQSDFLVAINNEDLIQSACIGNSLMFNVLDAKTFKPWKNVDENGNNLYRYGSASANCGPFREYNFEFSYLTRASRKLMMDFLDAIPEGSFVVVRSFDFDDPNSYSKTWKEDEVEFGAGNTVYDRLKNAGFDLIDSVNKPAAWLFVYKKGDRQSFLPQSRVGNSFSETVLLEVAAQTPDSLGYITSPLFGPAKQWKNVLWDGYAEEEASTDNPTIEVIGSNGSTSTTLFTLDKNTKSLDVSSVSVKDYPYLQLKMRNVDSANLTPYQLRYWRILYDPVPEGAIAPNILYKGKDTIDVGEKLDFAICFKNISNVSFDSVKVKLYLLDKNNVIHLLDTSRRKPLISGDTIRVEYLLKPDQYFPGQNTLVMNFNPDNDQPEDYLLNNFLYKSLFVRGDNYKPLLDVSFDGVHILNNDIVSSKPHILIKLKDDSKFLALDDTSLLKIQVVYPNGVRRNFSFNNDTIRFTPAILGTSGANNVASVDFSPEFLEDGAYELIVSGRDKSGNTSGVNNDYRVSFKVINKPMISNMFNYPNPFTTSTAFVFTLTGSQVPQNIRIQILTITGKIVREITKEELGPIRVGRNITDYKWDGTDQYGQKLANGVYLYRVITNLNGKSLDKYKTEGDNTDQYFNKGYGKMYLMR